MMAIFKREFKSYFQSVIGWLYIAATFGLFSLYFFAIHLNYGYAKISYTLNSITFFTLVIVPILTMRSLSEEQKNKTNQLILTSPVTIGKIITAKFLALAAIHTITIVLMGLTPFILSMFGTVPFAENYVAFFGFWMYGITGIAIGVFVSALTESQVIAAVLTFVLLFLGYMMNGVMGMISSTGNVFTKILSSYDLITPLNSFFDGTISVTSIIYYATICALFLFLAAQVLQKKRWSVSTKQLKTGAFSIGFIVIMVSITIVVNLFAKELPSTVTTIDVTKNKLYSLTDDTKTYLKSLDKDVTIYVLAAESSLDATIKESLERFEDSNSHIKVEFKDPLKYPTFFQKYTSEDISEGSLIFECGDVSRVVDYNDMFASEIDYTTYQSNVTGYDGEGQIVSALQYVTSDSLPVIYQLEGHGETALAGVFKEAVEKANISLESLNLLQQDAVPEDAEAIVINGLTADLSADDASKIIAYMEKGGNVFVTTNYQMPVDTPNLDSVLQQYQISVMDGLVAEGDSNSIYQNQPFYIISKAEDTTYTTGLANSYLFAPYSQAVTYPETADGITYTQLIATSDQAIAKTDIANATAYTYEEGDVNGPFSLAVAATKTLEDGSDSQLVVFGSQTFFTDEVDSVVAGTNSKIFTKVIAQLTSSNETGSIVIPVKNYDVSRLTVPTMTAYIIAGIMIVLIPVVFLGAGIVVWVKRRRR